MPMGYDKLTCFPLEFYIYIYIYIYIYMKSSNEKASKCHLKFSLKMSIFIRLLCLGSVILL